MPRYAVFGAAPDTMNMGVSALFASILSSISNRIPDSEFVVFDSGLGERRKTFQVSENQYIECVLYGGRAGFRFYRSENLASMSLLASMGQLGSLVNPGIRLIDSCDAVLDISGGDSFSDIYGRKRFLSIARPKQIAIKRKRPLILMPQTFGPYYNADIRNTASEIVRDADMVWARDANSYECLKQLLGGRFNPARHFCGVDMAFLLPTRSALSDLDDSPILDWLNSSGSHPPLVGFNINGLIYNDAEKSRSQYGFKADYEAIVRSFLVWVLENTECNVLLVPHVMAPEGHYESDLKASKAVAGSLPVEFSDRVAITPTSLDQCQVKWVISMTDWFCGTRMHSTIAALSTGVPTASIAYSDKTKGVFDSCRQAEHVLDPRKLLTDEIVEGLIRSYENRAVSKQSLDEVLPSVISTAEEQVDRIARLIQPAHR